MGLNMSGVTVSQLTNGVGITNNSLTTTFRQDGIVRMPNTPMFSAGCTSTGTDPAFAGVTGWRKLVFSAVKDSVGGCFSSSRFTAPVTGTYYISGNCYCNGGTANIDYVHPAFYVNGTASHARRNGVYDYRIRNHGRPVGLSFDTQMNELYSLQAGDYIEYYLYIYSATITIYPYYSQFSGCLLG